MRVSTGEKLSPELPVSFRGYTCDIDLSYEPIILDREQAKLRLTFTLDKETELDMLVADKEDPGVGLSFTPVTDIEPRPNYTAM